MIRVIKACKLYKTLDGKIIRDNEPIGLIKDVTGYVPKSYIKYIPQRIFDRRKYPDLYRLFGKDHLPTFNEAKLFQQKLLNAKVISDIPEDMKDVNVKKTNIIIRFFKYILGK